MKKIIVLLILFHFISFAQVGVNTTDPKATLHIIGDPTTATVLDGVIPPKITGAQLRAKTYTTNQVGAVVYVTTADTAPAGQTINVISEGLYSFSSDLIWEKVGGNRAKSGMAVVKADIVGIGNNTSGVGMTTIPDFTIPMKAGETITISVNLLVTTTNNDWSISLSLPNYTASEFITGQATWCNTATGTGIGNGSNWYTWRFSPSTPGFPRGTRDTSLGSDSDGVVRVELTYTAATSKNFSLAFGNDIVYGSTDHKATVKKGSSISYSIL